MRVYLSSPITKDADYRSTFAKLAKDWRAAGWEVFSAAEMNDMLGDDRGREDAMRVDIPILLTCHAILMAQGWEASRCCRCEWAIAEACGIEIHYERGPVPMATNMSVLHSEAQEVADLVDLLNLYERLNERHFGSSLPNVSFCFLDDDTPAETRGTTHLPDCRISIARRLLEDREALTATMLHEMIHVAIVSNPDIDDDGHGPNFANEANRIGRELGWSLVYSCEADSCLESARYWPTLSRVAPPNDARDEAMR